MFLFYIMGNIPELELLGGSFEAMYKGAKMNISRAMKSIALFSL